MRSLSPAWPPPVTCCLCGGPAQSTASGTNSHQTWVVECSAHCAAYEISEAAAIELLGKPHQRTSALEIISAIKAESPTNLAQIGFSDGQLRISARNSEQETIEELASSQ